MSLPGLDELQGISPEFAGVARRLGEGAWLTSARTPRETTACFLACDLVHGLFDLPLRLHVTMAKRLGVADGYILGVLLALAPAVGYPQVAQALTAVSALVAGSSQEPLSDREIAFLDAAASAAAGLVGTTVNLPVTDIIKEYGYLGSPRGLGTAHGGSAR